MNNQDTDHASKGEARFGKGTALNETAAKAAKAIKKKYDTPIEMPPTREKFAEICRSNGIKNEMEIGQLFEKFQKDDWRFYGIPMQTIGDLAGAVAMWKCTEGRR